MPKPTLFDKILGDPPRQTQGEIAPARGMRALSAKAAGVVVERAAPDDWIKLADSLPNAPKPQATGDGDSFNKRYGVVNQVAHVSPDLFYEFIRKGEIQRKFLERDIKTIEIDNQAGLRVTFRFIDPENTPDTISRTKARNIYKDGIAAAMRGREEVFVYNSLNMLVGSLSTQDITPDLKKHSLYSSPTVTRHRVSNIGQDRPLTPSECREIFHNTASFRSYMSDISFAGAVIVRDNTINNFLGRSVGTLYHPDDQPALLTTLPHLPLREVSNRIRDENYKDRKSYLSSIFGGAAGVVIKDNVTEAVAFAVLLAPSHSV